MNLSGPPRTRLRDLRLEQRVSKNYVRSVATSALYPTQLRDPVVDALPGREVRVASRAVDNQLYDETISRVTTGRRWPSN
jgi:hypothetical protein